MQFRLSWTWAILVLYLGWLHGFAWHPVHVILQISRRGWAISLMLLYIIQSCSKSLCSLPIPCESLNNSGFFSFIAWSWQSNLTSLISLLNHQNVSFSNVYSKIPKPSVWYMYVQCTFMQSTRKLKTSYMARVKT